MNRGTTNSELRRCYEVANAMPPTRWIHRWWRRRHWSGLLLCLCREICRLEVLVGFRSLLPEEIWLLIRRFLRLRVVEHVLDWILGAARLPRPWHCHLWIFGQSFRTRKHIISITTAWEMCRKLLGTGKLEYP